MASQVHRCSCCRATLGEFSLLALLPAQTRRGCVQNPQEGDTCQEYTRRFHGGLQSTAEPAFAWPMQGPRCRVRAAPLPGAAVLGGLGSHLPHPLRPHRGDSPAPQSRSQHGQRCTQQQLLKGLQPLGTQVGITRLPRALFCCASGMGAGKRALETICL